MLCDMITTIHGFLYDDINYDVTQQYYQIIELAVNPEY